MFADQNSRSAQRKLRLREIEKEQHLEDIEALKMTEEQRQSLLSSFQSVKAEFLDLDGLSWSRTALRKRSHVAPPRPSPLRPKATFSDKVSISPPPSAFAVLTNADLASFSPEDTIRIPTSRLVHQTHASQLKSHPYSRPARSRSPVKGLFPPGLPLSRDAGELFSDQTCSLPGGETEDADHGRGRMKRPLGPRTLSPIRVDLPVPGYSPDGSQKFISYSSGKTEAPSIPQTPSVPAQPVVAPSGDLAVSERGWEEDEADLKTPVPSPQTIRPRVSLIGN